MALRAPVRVLGLSETTYMYVVFRIKSPTGQPIVNAPFWVDIYAPPGQTSSYAHSFKGNTDDQGNLVADVPLSEFTTRNVSITPLLPYPDGPVNQAIVWQVPFLFKTDKSNVVDITLKPGGGLDSKPAVVVPPPAPSAPAPYIKPGQPEPSVGTDSTGYLILAGAVALVAGYFLIPMIWKGRRV